MKGQNIVDIVKGLIASRQASDISLSFKEDGDETAVYSNNGVVLIVEPQTNFLTRFTVSSYLVGPDRIEHIYTSDFKNESYSSSRDKSKDMLKHLKKYIDRGCECPDSLVKKEELGIKIRGKAHREIFFPYCYDNLPLSDLEAFPPLFHDVKFEITHNGYSELHKHMLHIHIAKTEQRFNSAYQQKNTG